MTPEHEAEFSMFYRAEIKRLVGFMITTGASTAEAADIAQEAMTELFRHWHKVSYPVAWVRKVAIRIYLRASVQPRTQTLDEWEAEATDQSRSALIDTRAASEFDMAIEMDTALKAIRQLPLRQRQVLALTVDGFTPSEIAEITGITPESTRSSLRVARQKVAGWLGTGEEAGADNSA